MIGPVAFQTGTSPPVMVSSPPSRPVIQPVSDPLVEGGPPNEEVMVMSRRLSGPAVQLMIPPTLPIGPMKGGTEYGLME